MPSQKLSVPIGQEAKSTPVAFPQVFLPGIAELFDSDAERALIGAMLEGGDCEAIEPTWLREDRRAILLTVDACRENGLLAVSPLYVGPASCHGAAVANAATVRQAMLEADVWPNADDPAGELRECLLAYTQPELLPDSVRRVRFAARRRQLAERVEHMVRLASSSTTTESEVLACL
jgi:hypothetical protein